MNENNWKPFKIDFSKIEVSNKNSSFSSKNNTPFDDLNKYDKMLENELDALKKEASKSTNTGHSFMEIIAVTVGSIAVVFSLVLSGILCMMKKYGLNFSSKNENSNSHKSDNCKAAEFELRLCDLQKEHDKFLRLFNNDKQQRERKTIEVANIMQGLIKTKNVDDQDAQSFLQMAEAINKFYE